MKRNTSVLLVMIFVLGLAMRLLAQTPTTTTTAQSSSSTTAAEPSTSASDQPLGDYARAVKKDKKQTAKSFDNDNIPTVDTLSVVGNSATSDAQNTPPNPAVTGGGKNFQGGKQHGSANPAVAGNDANDSPAADKPAGEEKLPTVTPGESMADREKVYGKWEEKLAEQKGKVDSLSHSIDTLQREYQLRQAQVYYDPASRARNDVSSDKLAADLKKELDEKQQALNDAKQGMDDMQENARKAGVPESVREGAADQEQK
jgi:hypothetical protein